MTRTLQGALAGLLLIGMSGIAAAQEAPHPKPIKKHPKPQVLWIEEEAENEAPQVHGDSRQVIIKILKDGEEKTIHLDGSKFDLPDFSGMDMRKLLRPIEKMMELHVDVDEDHDHDDDGIEETEVFEMPGDGNFPEMLLKRLTHGGEWDSFLRMDEDDDRGDCDGDCKCPCHGKRKQVRDERRMGPRRMRRLEGKIRDRMRPEIRRRIQKRMQGMRGKKMGPGSKGPRGMIFGGMPSHKGGAVHPMGPHTATARKTVEVKTDDGKTFTIEVSPKNEHPERQLHVFVDSDEHEEHAHHADGKKHVRKDGARGGHMGGHARPRDGHRGRVAQRLDRLMKELDRLKKELRELRREL